MKGHRHLSSRHPKRRIAPIEERALLALRPDNHPLGETHYYWHADQQNLSLSLRWRGQGLGGTTSRTPGNIGPSGGVSSAILRFGGLISLWNGVSAGNKDVSGVEMRGVLPNNGNNSIDTLNAAARAIASAERRVQQATVQKRRWGGCLSVYWCFGSHRQTGHIGDAVVVPESSLSENGASAVVSGQPPIPTPVFPFVAPPSSPVSFIQSEPPSSIQSPGGFLSLSISSNICSPPGHSIFALGPYAHETQLVSPPVFSTFTTEPSTAPFTPPPESVHLTTPSSPEVPFAKLVSSAFDANRKSGDKRLAVPLPFTSVQCSEFQGYQFYPGSPIGQLISPSSVISRSGTSSPFLDRELSSSGSFPSSASAVLTQKYEPPKLGSIDFFCNSRKSTERHAGNTLMEPLADMMPNPKLKVDGQVDTFASQIADLFFVGDVVTVSTDEQIVDHRVSFGLCTEEAESCKPLEVGIAVGCLPESPVLMAVSKKLSTEGNAAKMDLWLEGETDEPRSAGEGGNNATPDASLQAGEVVDLAMGKEFKFDNADGATERNTISVSQWWTGEKTGSKAGSKNWAFFPIVQTSIN